MSKRFPEIDLLRTLAILGMVVFHGAYDLAVFYDRDIAVRDGGWHLLQTATASLFLLLVGIGFAIGADKAGLWKRQRRRFMQIGAAALIISIATWIFDPHTYVRFGVLHLIAVASLLLPFFQPLREGSIAAGLVLLLLPTHTTGAWQPLAMILGFPPPGFATVDYFPLLPWFGVILIGYGLGHFLYVRPTKWRPALFDRIPSAATWPGRHSLMIYLVHQPIILSLLYILH